MPTALLSESKQKFVQYTNSSRLYSMYCRQDLDLEEELPMIKYGRQQARGSQRNAVYTG
jgi:hypothetical protein